MTEKPKRLAPKTHTLRELFLKSGNLCAFPNCTALMMNEKGVFIGQLCHIEAAEPGGPRFNTSMTNEQRRGVSNLMLMCYEHHQVTNDEDEYPVAKLKKTKRDHEQRFARPDRAILEHLTDWTLADQPNHVENLKRIEQVLGLDFSDEERAVAVSIFNDHIDRLAVVPIEVRRFVGTIAQRIVRAGDTSAVHDNAILISDVKHAFRLSDSKIKERLAQLESYDLGYLDELNTDLGSQPMIALSVPDDSISWIDIVYFCQKTSTPLESFTDDMDFSQLDS